MKDHGAGAKVAALQANEAIDGVYPASKLPQTLGALENRLKYD